MRRRRRLRADRRPARGERVAKYNRLLGIADIHTTTATAESNAVTALAIVGSTATPDPLLRNRSGKKWSSPWAWCIEVGHR